MAPYGRTIGAHQKNGAKNQSTKDSTADMTHDEYKQGCGCAFCDNVRQTNFYARQRRRHPLHRTREPGTVKPSGVPHAFMERADSDLCHLCWMPAHHEDHP